MKPRKTVLTTGDVARICKVAPRTVSKWFDQGHLRGYRIPGSKDRRIPLEQLVRFMKANNMPLDELDLGQTSLVLLSGDESFNRSLASSLEEMDDFEVGTAGNALEAGAVLWQLKPDVFVVDVELPDVEPTAVARFINGTEELRGTRLIGIGRGLDNGRGERLLQLGFSAYLNRPFQARELAAVIEDISII